MAHSFDFGDEHGAEATDSDWKMFFEGIPGFGDDKPSDMAALPKGDSILPPNGALTTEDKISDTTVFPQSLEGAPAFQSTYPDPLMFANPGYQPPTYFDSPSSLYPSWTDSTQQHTAMSVYPATYPLTASQFQQRPKLVQNPPYYEHHPQHVSQLFHHNEHHDHGSSENRMFHTKYSPLTPEPDAVCGPMSQFERAVRSRNYGQYTSVPTFYENHQSNHNFSHHEPVSVPKNPTPPASQLMTPEMDHMDYEMGYQGIISVPRSVKQQRRSTRSGMVTQDIASMQSHMEANNHPRISSSMVVSPTIHLSPDINGWTVEQAETLYRSRGPSFWRAPTTWTVAAANARAQSVLSCPLLSETTLPFEAALLFMPEHPSFPPLLNAYGSPVYSTRYPTVALRDIPWLPRPFDVRATESWRINLFMVFGATVRDMAARIAPGVDDVRTRTQLENRILKKTLDWRNKYGGFGQDPRPIKGDRVTDNARNVLLGNKEGPPPRTKLTDAQLIFGVHWHVDLEQWTMRQSPSSKIVYPLPEPKEVDQRLVEVFLKLGHNRRSIPTLANLRLMLRPSDGAWPQYNDGGQEHQVAKCCGSHEC